MNHIEKYLETIRNLQPGQSLIISVVDDAGKPVKSPPQDVQERNSMTGATRLVIDPKYGSHDCDTLILFAYWDEPSCTVLEVGANEEAIAPILQDNGNRVIGVDLRPPLWPGCHIQGDFVAIAPLLKPEFDVVVSTSAIEHFGLPIYGFDRHVEDYDSQAMDAIWDVLKPGGRCYITVPYGRDHRNESDWRVYNQESLQKRIIRKFAVEKRMYFLSGGCACPADANGIVLGADADAYDAKLPHVTVFLKLLK